jgi:O-antigen/teichoic acid export membrane protein
MASGDKSSAIGLMKFVFINRVVFAAAAALAVGFGSRLISSLFLKSDAYAFSILLMIPGAFFTSVSDGLAHNAQAIRRFGLTSLASLAGGIALVVSSISLYLTAGVNGYLIGLGLGPFVQLCINLAGLGDCLFVEAPLPGWSKTLRYSFPFYLRAIVQFAIRESDKLITGMMLSPATFAGYGIARKFTDYINLYGESIRGPMLIKLAETVGKHEQTQISAYSSVARYGIMIIAPPCLAVACASPFLMTLFGGGRYYQYWPILTLLAIAQVAYFLSCFFGGMMVFVLGAPMKTLLSDAMPGILSPLSSILLIIEFGQSGTAWSQLITYICAIIVTRLLLANILKTKIDLGVFRTLSHAFVPAATIVILAQLLFFGNRCHHGLNVFGRPGLHFIVSGDHGRSRLDAG